MIRRGLKRDNMKFTKNILKEMIGNELLNDIVKKTKNKRMLKEWKNLTEAKYPFDEVKVGTPLFYDKNNNDVLYTSSVSGIIQDIVYGKRRTVESIVISNDKKYNSITVASEISKETLPKTYTFG